jgi:hypothetical protein
MMPLLKIKGDADRIAGQDVGKIKRNGRHAIQATHSPIHKTLKFPETLTVKFQRACKTAEAMTNRKANNGIFFYLPPFQTESSWDDYDVSEEHVNRK